MERMTKLDNAGCSRLIEIDEFSLFSFLSIREGDIVQDAIDRLAAYEDAMPLERVQELARAEKAGRLVVLPDDRDAAFLAAVIGEDDILRTWSGGDNDLLPGLLSALSGEAAEKLGVRYKALLMSVMLHPRITDLLEEGGKA